MNDAIKPTLIITGILENLGIPYFIGGSIAGMMFGELRATMDVDIVATLTIEKVRSFVSVVEKEFYVDEEAVRSAIKRKSSFNLLHLETFFKVDIFVSREREFDQKQLARGIKVTLLEPDGIVTIASPEDSVLAKLDWYRLGDEVSEKQWRDIQGIFEFQKNELDLDYMRHWAKELQILELFERALKESNL